MRYLLDVNALVAWHHPGSLHHQEFHLWAKKVGLKNLGTCALTELGFLRVSMQVFRYSREDALLGLEGMRAALKMFIDKSPPPELADWVRRPRQTTDAYLSQIAAAAGWKLATFDAAIPGATLIARP